MWYFHYWHLLKTNPKQTGHSGAHLQSRCLDGRSLVNLQPGLHSKFYPTQSKNRGLKIFFLKKKKKGWPTETQLLHFPQLQLKHPRRNHWEYANYQKHQNLYTALRNGNRLGAECHTSGLGPSCVLTAWLLGSPGHFWFRLSSTGEQVFFWG